MYGIGRCRNRTRVGLSVGISVTVSVPSNKFRVVIVLLLLLLLLLFYLFLFSIKKYLLTILSYKQCMVLTLLYSTYKTILISNVRYLRY